MNKLKLMLLIMILALAGCQQAEDLEASVNSRWQAIIEQDLDKAYGYFSPGYRNTETLEGFKLRLARAQLNIKWTEGKFESTECSSDEVCEAAVRVVYSYSFPKKSLGGVEDIPTTIKEQWIQINGKWYHVPEKN